VVAKDKLSSYGAHPATVQSLLKWSFWDVDDLLFYSHCIFMHLKFPLIIS
jgi:hypothetical protein